MGGGRGGGAGPPLRCAFAGQGSAKGWQKWPAGNNVSKTIRKSVIEMGTGGDGRLVSRPAGIYCRGKREEGQSPAPRAMIQEQRGGGRALCHNPESPRSIARVFEICDPH